MPSAPDPAPSPPKPRKRWLPRLRFSLRTLVIGVLLVGSAGGLWWRWEPWAQERVWTDIDINGSFAGAFSPDGDRILLPTIGIYNFSGAPDVKIWADGDYVGAFSHSGRRVFLGGLAKARIVDAISGQTAVEIDASKTGSWFRSAFFCFNDSQIIAATDGGAWLWREKSGNAFMGMGNEYFPAEAQSSDGKMIAGNSGVYDNSFKRIAQLDGVYFFKDNCRVLARTAEQLIIADAFSGNVAMHFPVNSGPDAGPCVSPDERWLAVFYDDSCLRVWNIATGHEQAVIKQADSILREVAFSRDSTRLFARVSNEPIRIWDAMSGRLLYTLARTEYVNQSPDGIHLLTADETPKCARLWRRRRPEYWWGVAWLPEFWLTALFAGALGWSVWRDRKMQPLIFQQRT